MSLDYYEQAYTTDPLTLMLMAEDEAECTEGSTDVLESERRAGLHRTAPKSSSIERQDTGHYGWSH